MGSLVTALVPTYSIIIMPWQSFRIGSSKTVSPFCVKVQVLTSFSALYTLVPLPVDLAVDAAATRTHDVEKAFQD